MDDSASYRAFRQEWANADAVVKAAGAVMTAEDGFKWVDESKLNADFVLYYQGLRQAGYARGWL